MSQQMPEQIPFQMFALVMKKSKNFEVLFPRNSNQEGAIPALSVEKSLALSCHRFQTFGRVIAEIFSVQQ